jgi:hypothetical protein
MTPMKKIMICLGLLVAGMANADELADANTLFQKKAYPQAVVLYTRLANAGNAEAQLHLGQMYWYGEAGAVDEARADAWFRKAAAKGNKAAAAALDVMKQRQAQRAQIDFWIAKYDGADLKAGKFQCAVPRIPAISKDNAEIKRVANNVEVWQECYNGFVANMNANSAISAKIPGDIARLLNQNELDAAKAHYEEVHARIGADASIGAKLLLADFAAWRGATETWVADHNALVRSSTANDRSSESDARKNNYAPVAR